MPITVAPKYKGIPHVNRRFEGWEVYVHGGRSYGVFSTKVVAKKKAREIRNDMYNEGVPIKVVNKNGGVKHL